MVPATTRQGVVGRGRQQGGGVIDDQPDKMCRMGPSALRDRTPARGRAGVPRTGLLSTVGQRSLERSAIVAVRWHAVGWASLRGQTARCTRAALRKGTHRRRSRARHIPPQAADVGDVPRCTQPQHTYCGLRSRNILNISSFSLPRSATKARVVQSEPWALVVRASQALSLSEPYLNHRSGDSGALIGTQLAQGSAA